MAAKTASVTHVFNDVSNSNISLTTGTSEVTVQAQALGDSGATTNYNTSLGKHYRINFGSGVKFGSADDITITPTSSATASHPPSGVAPPGSTTSGFSFSVSKKIKSGNSLDVWFTANGSQNSFIRSFSVGYITETTTTIPPSEACGPGPWTPALPTGSCPSPPGGSSGTGGIELSTSGSNGITVSLKNYPNKLVTLKMTASVRSSGGGYATNNTCTIDVPNSSDFLIGSTDVGGDPYNKSSYTATSNFTADIYNVDGGSSFTVTHSSSTPSAPTRIVTKEVCVTSGPDSEGNITITCSCQFDKTETYSPWLPCSKGVAIGANNGSTVSWVYQDGLTGGFGAQVTLEVVKTRDCIPFTGPITLEDLQTAVWITPSSSSYLDADGEPGHCIDDYYNHPDKIRFRKPSTSESVTSINTGGIIFNEFRGVAGAEPPA